LIEELDSNKEFLRFTKLSRGTAFVTQSNTKYLAVTIEYDDGTKEDVGDCFLQYPVDNEENTATSDCIDLKIKTYCSLHPDFYRIELNYEGTIIGPWEGYIPALMDKPFSDDNDQLCYIVKRTRNNVVKYLVFTSFDEAKAKVNKYDKINETTEAQYLLCKKCVKKNILYAKTKKMVLDRETSPKNYIHTKVMQIMHKYLVKIFGCKQASLIWSYSNSSGGNFECENKMDEFSRIHSEILVGSLSLGDYIPSGDREQKVYLVQVSTNKSTFFKVFINENESSYKEYLRRMTNYQKLFTARMNTCKECMKNILVSQDGTNAKFGAYMNNDILANPEVREDTENKFTSILTKISSGCEYAEAILENVASQDDTCKVSCVNYLHPDSYFEITTVDGIYYNMDAPDDD
jgi:hypothetical protein